MEMTWSDGQIVFPWVHSEGSLEERSEGDSDKLGEQLVNSSFLQAHNKDLI